MTTTLSAAPMVLTMCAVGLLTGPPAQTRSERLDPRISAANPQQYRSIRDTKDWKNPKLMIRRDGIEVSASGLPSGRKTIALTDLRRTLLDLPVSAWPYGRVVAVQENGVRAAHGSDDERIAHNLDATLGILKGLQVTAERWPSA